MTIGIVARGPNAGLAVFQALRSVERVASGSIGGFAAFVAIDIEGRCHQHATQRGGASTLFTDGETTGVPPTDQVAAAPLAAVMSSGPDRPEPLGQFVLADPDAGIVSGHRLPNGIGAGGVAFNHEVLTAMRAGRSAQDAVDAVIDANSDGDVGLIAVDLAGSVYARNSDRVARRPDLGHARREDATAGALVEVLHNAIGPGAAIAALAAEVALQVMAPAWEPDDWFVVKAGTPVEAGEANRVELDEGGIARVVVTSDRSLLSGRRNGVPIYLGAEVRQAGRVLGQTISEPNVVIEDGRIVTLSGQRQLRIGYRRRRAP
jgi:hypothetical protein